VPNRGTLTALIWQGRGGECVTSFLRPLLSQRLSLSQAPSYAVAWNSDSELVLVVILFGAGLAAGCYRSRSRIFSGYKIAQEIDRRLGFKDVLSTAFYFTEHVDRSASPREFVERQRNMAEDLARSADIERGVPFLAPRTLYVNAALAVLACGMFGLRYGIQRNLDLRPSLVRISFEGFLGPSRDIAQAKKGLRPSDGQKEADSTRDSDSKSGRRPGPGTDRNGTRRTNRTQTIRIAVRIPKARPRTRETNRRPPATISRNQPTRTTRGAQSKLLRRLSAFHRKQFENGPATGRKQGFEPLGRRQR